MRLDLNKLKSFTSESFKDRDLRTIYLLKAYNSNLNLLLLIFLESLKSDTENKMGAYIYAANDFFLFKCFFVQNFPNKYYHLYKLEPYELIKELCSSTGYVYSAFVEKFGKEKVDALKYLQKKIEKDFGQKELEDFNIKTRLVIDILDIAIDLNIQNEDIKKIVEDIIELLPFKTIADFNAAKEIFDESKPRI